MTTAELLKELKNQHTNILALTSQVNAKLDKQDRSGVAEKLEELKKTLIEHINFEDKELYPALINVAETDGNAKARQMADTYSDAMLRITDGLLGFFRRHKADTLDLTRVRAEWSAVSAALTGRIGSEEATLYPLLSKARKP